MDWSSFFFALAFVSFSFVCSLRDNGKEGNAKRKTGLCYVVHKLGGKTSAPTEHRKEKIKFAIMNCEYFL